jgi:hypothetical protein
MKFSSWLRVSVMVMTILPFAVVTAPGSYHSASPVGLNKSIIHWAAHTQLCLPVVEVYGFSKRIVARIEGTSIYLELVAENKYIILAISPYPCACGSWGSRVNEDGHPWNDWYLTSCVDANRKKRSWVVMQGIENDRISRKQKNEACAYDEQHAGAGPSTKRPDGPSAVPCGVLCRVLIEVMDGIACV